MKKLSFLFAALVAGMSLSVRAEFSAWVYDYGSNTPRATQESWTAANLVDITAGASKATFSADVYNNERNCFDGNTVTRWISNVRTPWVIYNFDAATKISAYGIRQSSNSGYDGRVPISWELYGSNAETPPTTVDDASWVKLDTRTSVFHNYSEVQTKYDFGSRVMCLEQPANYRSYLLKVTGNNGGDGRTVIGELEFYKEPFPCDVKFQGNPVLSYQDGAFKASGSFISSVDCEIQAVIGDGQTEVVKTVGAFTGSDVEQFFDYVPSDLEEDKTYRIRFTSTVGSASAETDDIAFYTGTLALSKLCDAKEEGNVPAELTVSRAADDPVALAVNVVFTEGTAKEGRNYEPAKNPVVIPAGETTATFNVVPIADAETNEDTEMTVSISGGVCKGDIPAVAVTIINASLSADKNVWIATAASDGLASTAANWSQGVPQAGQKILFDPQFSTANCEWDGGVNGLTTSVSEWNQLEGYTGTVTFDTTYTGAFTALAVAGDVTVNGGSWTHQRGAVNNSTPTYRLKVTVGGAFTLGASAKVDLKAKGLAGGQKPSGSSAGSHASSCDGYSKVYGNVYAPDMPGSGSNGSNNWGGGAFWLEVIGAATIDGTITVRTDEKDGINQPAAGSVYIKAASCGGAGHIYADYEATSSWNGGGGSGGRVAIVLTEATEMAFPEANVAIKGRLTGGTHGGGGTFFYKTANQANGTLVLDDVREKNFSVRWHKPTQITAIPAGETWTFDAIKIKRYGMLAIPEGTTLNLPNGPESVSASSTRQGGLLYQGGTINWGSAPYVFSGNWIFQPNVPYAFNGDVTIADKGAIGCMIYQGSTDFSDAAKCEFTVNGTLTINQGGAIYAKGGGPDQPVSKNSYAAHGGATMNEACLDTVYDSIFDPAYPGYTAADGDLATTRSGGGLVKVTVNGDLVLNGTINAEGWLNGDIGAAGAGGTINIVAQTLSGEGAMTVDATQEWRWTYYNVGGAGRIAVRLTDGVFSDYWKSHITAKGRSWYDSSKSAEHGASAGTVYLQEKGVAEKAGEIIVRNDNVDDEYKPYTYLPVTSTKAPTDALEDFKNARLSLLDKALVKISSTFKLRSLAIDAGSIFDLNGQTLTVNTAKLGDTKLKPGTYAAGATALGDFVIDSVGGGSLVVKGSGLMLLVR